MLMTSRILFSCALAVVILGGSSACGDVVGTPIAAGGDALANDGSNTTDGGGGADDSSTPPDDGGADARAPATIVVEVTTNVLGQNCMPVVPPDPVTAQGKWKIQNRGATPVGPVTITGATFLDGATNAPVATFAVTSAPLSVAAGSNGETTYTKDADSIDPKKGCATLECNKPYIVELAYSGPGVPSGAKARSAAAWMGCVY